ncbi:MAG: acetyltransferase [Gammaproteobacteria bacterium]
MGSGVIPNVSVGARTVVARAAVVSDLPAGVIAAGVQARAVKGTP